MAKPIKTKVLVHNNKTIASNSGDKFDHFVVSNDLIDNIGTAVTLTKDFDDSKVLGYATLSRGGDNIYADLYIGTKTKAVPSLAYPSLRMQLDQDTGEVTKVIEVSLCANPNVDRRVPPIEIKLPSIWQ